MGEWVIGATVGDLKALSWGSIPPFPTKNQRVSRGFLSKKLLKRRVLGSFRGFIGI